MRPSLNPGLMVLAVCFQPEASAFDWSMTEVHYQHGDLQTPSFARRGRTRSVTDIVTLQHADGWKYGDNFFFMDILNDARRDGYNESDFYGELYLNGSLSKISGHKIGYGWIKDVGILMGFNGAANSKVFKYLPGLRLAWDIPGFAFLNSDFTAYIDSSSGLAGGGSPSQTDSWMVDINGAYPFTLGKHRFLIIGHMEYIDGRRNELGGEVAEWFLAQPQFRYDLGHTLFGKADHFYVGTEWQVWIHKQGDRKTYENVPQALAVWRF
jgi:hypothetical protein